MSSFMRTETQREALLDFAQQIESLATPMSEELSQDCCGARLIAEAGRRGGTVQSVFGICESELHNAIMTNKSTPSELRNARMATDIRQLATELV